MESLIGVPGEDREEVLKTDEEQTEHEAIVNVSEGQIQKVRDEIEELLNAKSQRNQLQRGTHYLPAIPKNEQVPEYDSRFSSLFSVESILGQGTFGIVFKVVNRDDSWKYAVKRIDVPSDDNVMTELLLKARTIARLDHPSLVRYYETWIEKPPEMWQNEADSKLLKALSSSCLRKNPREDNAFLYFRMQLYNYSLEEWLTKNKSIPSRQLSRMTLWFKQMVSALDYLHDRLIFHRNMKTSNILFSGEDALVLSDVEFGLMDLTNEKDMMREDLYRSSISGAEQVTRIPNNSKSDIFSLGLIFAEMCVVMTDDERKKVFENYRIGKDIQALDHLPEVKEFVALLTNVLPEKRPDCRLILKHSIFKYFTEENSVIESMHDEKLSRCRNFPQCPLLSKCKYVHPRLPCTMFPQCPQGSECLFLHEFCPNDSQCEEPNCPYEHLQSVPTYYRTRRGQEHEMKTDAAIVPLTRTSDLGDSNIAQSNLHRSLQRVHVYNIEFHLPDEYSPGGINNSRATYIGSGTLGVVIRGSGKFRRGQTIEVAIKKIRNSEILVQRTAQMCYRELKLLQNLNHENITRLVDMYTSALNAHELNDVYFVTEYVGSTMDIHLRESLIARHPYLSMAVFPRIIRDTLRALEYLQHANVLHLNLKPSNIAIHGNGKAVLIDFGLATTGVCEDNFVMAHGDNAIQYSAPEVNFWEQISYDREADIWSLGCILAELITWEPLFIDVRSKVTFYISLFGPISDRFLSKVRSSDGTKRYIEIKNNETTRSDLKGHFIARNKVANFNNPQHCTALDLISKCVQFDPEFRITIDEARRHPFLADIYAPEDYSHVQPVVFNDEDRTIDEWKRTIFEEIINFSPREGIPGTS